MRPMTEQEWSDYLAKVRAVLVKAHPGKDVDGLIKRALNYGDRVGKESTSYDEIKKRAARYSDKLQRRFL